MTEEKRPDVEDIDWDQALAEWENKSFVPEVAKDVVTDKPGALAGSSASRPLYRPPAPPQGVPRPKAVAPPVPRARPSGPPRSRSADPIEDPGAARSKRADPNENAGPASALRPRSVPPPLPAVPPPPPLPAVPPPPSPSPLPEDDDASSTLIAEIPDELLRENERPLRPSHAGLGPLFAREEGRSVGEETLDEGGAGPPTDAPLRTPPVPVHDTWEVDEPAFDAFAARPRSMQPTRPADEEVDDLLRSSAPPRPGARVSDRPAGGPPLLAPDTRAYDPNEVTFPRDDDALARAAVSLRTKRSQPALADDQPTDRGARSPALAFEAPTRTWPSEHPAQAWLSESAAEALASRAEWLEEEARALGDKVARARGLLVCSEMLAMVGDKERAHALAVEARDLAPSVALSHRQARSLAPPSVLPAEHVEALDAELKVAPAGPARVHATLLAAELLRTAGDDEGAAKRLDQAARITASDVRAPLARAVRALQRGDTSSSVLRLPDSPELGSLAQALQTLLRLRGVEPADGETDGASSNELLLQARRALDNRDLAAAAHLVDRVGQGIPELARGAAWLAASLGAVVPARRTESIQWLGDLAEHGDAQARRAVVARALEQDDRDLLAKAVVGPGPLTSADRVTLAMLAGLPLGQADPHIDATASAPGMAPLAAAAVAVSPVVGQEAAAQRLARADRAAGAAVTRSLGRLGRLLAARAAPSYIEAALESIGDDAKSSAARAVALEMSARTGRALDVSAALEAWGTARASGEERAIGALAGALVAEQSGYAVRALAAYKAARAADPTNEAALRAIASLEPVDLVAEMNSLADELGDGPRSAIARIEAVARGEGLLPEPTRADLLDRAHQSAPTLPIAAFLAERIARRAGDVEEVLRWIHARRASQPDAIDAALDAVREALLVADADPALAAERLEEAHRARPADVALRELYERVAPEPPKDRAAWREQRGEEASGVARALLYLEAAHEHERAGDEEGALRSAQAAAATEAALGRIARERAELRAGQVARLAEELLGEAKSAQEARPRREAYERLAVLDATARKDPASALLWHRSILEENPAFEPSLRHVEHHLIGEGRDDELEPIASAIALALRGTGPGEATSHAELAARLRMRGATGSWDATREMVELAASEAESSLWSLRMRQAHARARGDDVDFLEATLRLVERVPRPSEQASLLARAGEAALRLGQFDEARRLLERAALEDPGDVVVWGLLAEIRQRAGDPRGAAEACESLARSSLVRENQLLAWYDAGRIWTDEARDEERAIIALEAAAAIDPAHEDVFDRLSRTYATQGMQNELAALLERRLAGIDDPTERLAMEVRRGRVLLEVGDTQGARDAFEAALAERPDDPGALSAFADLCVAQHDWEAAEQALVRLARLLPTAEEQRDVYGRLGDLYARHLLNLSRAEAALHEVLKRAPDDVATMEKLVDVYKRRNDPARAVELQQGLVARATSPEEKRRRVLELVTIHEQTAHDNRRAEQTLEAARREFPQDVVVLRALAEFYTRHRQAPAVNILLDRAAADARRTLAAGRFSAPLFDLLGTIFELRGRKDAARVTQTLLAAIEGRPADLGGASELAFDPRLDDVVAPELLTAPLRALLAKTGEALDTAAPFDLRAMKPAPAPADSPLARFASGVAASIGLGGVQVLVASKAGANCIPVGSVPPTILVGDSLAAGDPASTFLVLRALHLVRAKASALGRTQPADIAVLVAAWLKCFNPSWQPQGIHAAALAAACGRVQAALPRSLDPEVGVLALEAAAALGTQAPALGQAALAWADRVALLALGDPNAALDAIAGATSHGRASVGEGSAARTSPPTAPRDPAERATWIARTPEARDLVAFGVTDAFADARARLGLDR
jgi:tetratricopeptide (TPR) repeat protein